MQVDTEMELEKLQTGEGGRRLTEPWFQNRQVHVGCCRASCIDQNLESVFEVIFLRHRFQSSPQIA